MSRRPRPTYRQLDALQRRYDAVVATMNRVVEERDRSRYYLNIYSKEFVTQRDAAKAAQEQLSDANIRISTLKRELEELRPMTVGDLCSVLWSGLCGKGWHRRP